MPKLNEKYETMVVFSLKNGEEQIEGLREKFTSLIEANAELVSVNEWGKRRLAYPINYENDGYYVLYSFDSKPDFPKELERVFNITEGVIRFLTVLRPDAPSKTAEIPPEEDEETEDMIGEDDNAAEVETDDDAGESEKGEE